LAKADLIFGRVVGPQLARVVIIPTGCAFGVAVVAPSLNPHWESKPWTKQ
jgi:hypothetical protein